MPYYLVQTAYTPEAWATMIKNPQDRIALVRPAIESVGGTIEAGYLSFGEYDLVAIVEFPDNAAAAAFSVATTARGALKSFKTTPLLTMAEAQNAMKAASSLLEPDRVRILLGRLKPAQRRAAVAGLRLLALAAPRGPSELRYAD